MKAIQHVALNCRNMRAMEDFYTRHFGFRRARTFNPGTDQEFLMLRLGGFCIEMFQVQGEALEFEVCEQPVGFKHMAFEVPDIEAAIAALEAEGVVTTGIIPCADVTPRLRICFFQDPDGNRVELMEGWEDEA